MTTAQRSRDRLIGISSTRSLPSTATAGAACSAEDTGKPQLFYVQGAEKSSVSYC